MAAALSGLRAVRSRDRWTDARGRRAGRYAYTHSDAGAKALPECSVGWRGGVVRTAAEVPGFEVNQAIRCQVSGKPASTLVRIFFRTGSLSRNALVNCNPTSYFIPTREQ